jgi:hypothetical protein
MIRDGLSGRDGGYLTFQKRLERLTRQHIQPERNARSFRIGRVHHERQTSGEAIHKEFASRTVGLC